LSSIYDVQFIQIQAAYFGKISDETIILPFHIDVALFAICYKLVRQCIF